MSNDTERKDFEERIMQLFAYAKDDFNFADGEYIDPNLNNLYLAWQARAALSTEAQGEAVCDLCKGSGEYTHLVGGGPDAYDELGPCPSCDGTGDVHRADGEYLGKCDCNHQPANTEAQPEVTGAVAWRWGNEAAWLLTDEKPVSDDPSIHVEPLYPPSAIEAAVREKLEEAAALVIRQLGVEHGEILADDIRALMESPHTTAAAPTCTSEEAAELAKTVVGGHVLRLGLAINGKELAAIINADRSKR